MSTTTPARHESAAHSVTSTVTVRALRENLSDVLGRVTYGHERVLVTRNGRPAAMLIDIDDLLALEALEELADTQAYKAAKAADDGERIPLDQLDEFLAAPDAE